MGAALVLFCSQESCCYIVILSMRALRPHFHATSGFFLNRRINAVYIESVIIIKLLPSQAKGSVGKVVLECLQ